VEYRSMGLVDDDGRFLGTVNVVDALVVVLVLGVGAAGAAFVVGGGGGGTAAGADRYATLTVPDDGPSARFPEGTELAIAGLDQSLVVTDSRRVVLPNGSVRTAIRVRGRSGGGLLGSDPGLSLQHGDRLRTTGTSESLSLRVVRTGNRSALSTHRVGVVARATADLATATRIRRASSEPAGTGDRAVRLLRTDSFPTTGRDRRLRLGLDLRMLDTGDAVPMRAGTAVPVVVDELATEAEVVTVGRTTPPGDRVNRTVVVRVANVERPVAGTLSTGDRTVGTNHPATVTGVTVRPAPMVVTDAEGLVHERAHPRLRTVTLRLSAPVRQYGGSLWYQDERLRVGRSLLLDTGRVALEGRVIGIRTTDTPTARRLRPPHSQATAEP
jgi:hypothetical protein